MWFVPPRLYHFAHFSGPARPLIHPNRQTQTPHLWCGQRCPAPPDGSYRLPPAGFCPRRWRALQCDESWPQRGRWRREAPGLFGNGFVHIRSHAVAADDHLVPGGHIVQPGSGNHTFGFQIRHALGVVDQRAQGGHLVALFGQLIGQLHGPIHAKAEPGGLGFQNLHGCFSLYSAPRMRGLFILILLIQLFPGIRQHGLALPQLCSRLVLAHIQRGGGNGLAEAHLHPAEQLHAAVAVDDAAGDHIHPGGAGHHKGAALDLSGLAGLGTGALREDQKALALLHLLHGHFNRAGIALAPLHAEHTHVAEHPAQQRIHLEQFLLGHNQHPFAPETGNDHEHRINGGDVIGGQHKAPTIPGEVLLAHHPDAEHQMPDQPGTGHHNTIKHACFLSRLAFPGFSNPAEDQRLQCLKALFQIHLAGIHQNSILRLPQRCGGPVAVLIIPAADVLQNGFEISVHTFFLQFPEAAGGPGLGAGGEEDLHTGVRQDHGADVPPIHQDVVGAGHAPLQFQQKGTHRRMSRHCTGGHAHLFGPDGLAHVLTAQKHTLGAVHIAQLDLDLGQKGRDRCLILGVHALAQGEQTDGAIHGAGVHIQIAQLLCQALGKSRFSRPGGAVDGNRDHVFSYFLLFILCKAAPPLMLQICGKRLSGTPGNLQVVAAGVGVHVQHFAGKVKAGAELGLHGFRIHLLHIHAAGGDHRVGKVAPLSNGHLPVLDKPHQLPLLLLGDLIGPGGRVHAPALNHHRLHAGGQQLHQRALCALVGQQGKIVGDPLVQLLLIQSGLQVDDRLPAVFLHVLDVAGSHQGQRAGDTEMGKQHLAHFGKHGLFVPVKGQGHVLQRKAHHGPAILVRRDKAAQTGHGGDDLMPRLLGQLVAVAGGTSHRVAHTAGGHQHRIRGQRAAAFGHNARGPAFLDQKLFRPVVQDLCPVRVAQQSLADVLRLIAHREHPAAPLSF